MSSLDCSHATLSDNSMCLAARGTLVAGLGGTSGGEVADGEFAVEGDGAVEVLDQPGTVIADADFELHRCWKRGLACWRKSRISKCRRSVESAMGPEIDQLL